MKHAFLIVALLTAACHAQLQSGSAAISVGVCELTNNPDIYAGKRIEVHGRVTQGFENFTLIDEQCSGIGNAIWLTYGDQKEHVDYDQRHAAQQIPRTGFVRDRESERLQGLLQAFRPFTPDGHECGESCSYYKVFATVTGWFITGKQHGNGRGGLGHMGCCYLLVMERVSGVTGLRTDVPYGGVYKCSTDEWRPSSAELAALSRPSVERTASYQDWRSARMQVFAKVAQHWHDAEVLGGHVSITTNGWISSDLLRRYDIRMDNQGTTVVREVCSPTLGRKPKELTSEVLCKKKYWEQPRANRKAPVQPISALEQETAARNLVSEAGNSLGITEPVLLINTCNDELSSNYDMGECSFTTNEGDVSVWVELGRTQKQNKKGQYDWKGIPWSAYRINASICSE